MQHEFLPGLSQSIDEGAPDSSALPGPEGGVSALTVDTGHVWVADKVDSGPHAGSPSDSPAHLGFADKVARNAVSADGNRIVLSESGVRLERRQACLLHRCALGAPGRRQDDGPPASHGQQSLQYNNNNHGDGVLRQLVI